MADANERARFEAWWLGGDGPYSIRAERPSSMTEAAFMGWRAREAENAKLRAALTEIRDAGPMTLDDQRWRVALAALGGEND